MKCLLIRQTETCITENNFVVERFLKNDVPHRIFYENQATHKCENERCIGHNCTEEIELGANRVV